MPLALRSLLFACLLLLSSVGGRAASEIPFRWAEGMIWLEVVAGGGQKLRFLLDSGAGMSVLDRAAAQRLAVPLGHSSRIMGVNGAATAHHISNFQGTVAGWEMPRKMLALNLGPVSAVCHRQIDGLLGADFFRDHLVQLDFGAQKLRLLQTSEMPRGSATSIPLARRGDSYCVQVSVNSSAPSWVRVDTGCNSSLRWVVGSGATGSSPRRSIGLAVKGETSAAAEVQLGSLHFAGLRIGTHAKAIFPGEAGLLGTGLLSRFLVTFDVPGKRLLLQPR